MNKERSELAEKLLSNLADLSEVLGSDYALRKNDPFGKLLKDNPEPFLDAFEYEQIIAFLKKRRDDEGIRDFETAKEILGHFGFNRDEVLDEYNGSDPVEDLGLDDVVADLVEYHGSERVLDAVHKARLLREPGYSETSRPRSVEEFDI